MAFDWNKYNQQYAKDHYQRITIRIKIEEKEAAEKTAKKYGLTVGGLALKLLRDAIQENEKT